LQLLSGLARLYYRRAERDALLAPRRDCSDRSCRHCRSRRSWPAWTAGDDRLGPLGAPGGSRPSGNDRTRRPTRCRYRSTRAGPRSWWRARSPHPANRGRHRSLSSPAEGWDGRGYRV